MTSSERLNLPDRFWSKVDKNGPGGCWLWIAGLDAYGYGQFSLFCGARKSHRLALEEAVGPPPPDKYLAIHSCRNTHCVNPAHLRWGSYRDNHDDMARDGTRAYGEAVTHRGIEHANAKLTEREVLLIRGSAETGVYLSRKFKISPAQVSNIKNRRQWQHL